MNNQEKDFGRLENLQLKINRLRQESKDPGFTQYLNTVQSRLDVQTQVIMNLENEVNQNYRVYLQHFGVQAQPVVQPVAMPAQEPVTQPFVPPVQEPVAQPVAQPAQQVYVQPQNMYQSQYQYQQPVKKQKRKGR